MEEQGVPEHPGERMVHFSALEGTNRPQMLEIVSDAIVAEGRLRQAQVKASENFVKRIKEYLKKTEINPYGRSAMHLDWAEPMKDAKKTLHVFDPINDQVADIAFGIEIPSNKFNLWLKWTPEEREEMALNLFHSFSGVHYFTNLDASEMNRNSEIGAALYYEPISVNAPVLGKSVAIPGPIEFYTLSAPIYYFLKGHPFTNTIKSSARHEAASFAAILGELGIPSENLKIEYGTAGEQGAEFVTVAFRTESEGKWHRLPFFPADLFAEMIKKPVENIAGELLMDPFLIGKALVKSLGWRNRMNFSFLNSKPLGSHPHSDQTLELRLERKPELFDLKNKAGIDPELNQLLKELVTELDKADELEKFIKRFGEGPR